MHFWMTSFAIFATFLVIVTTTSPWAEEVYDEAINDVCLTQECNATATRINDSMNRDVHPCDDFYEFTCGTFVKNAIIPEEDDTVEVFGGFEKEYELQLKGLLEADIEKGDIRTFRLAKTLYKSCMNEDAIKAAGLRPFKNLMKALGGWPVLEGDSWNEENFDWIASTAEWYRYGLQPVRPPSWMESRFLKEGFNATKETRAYYKSMVDVAVSLGAETKRAEDELKEALLFHIELSKLTASSNPRSKIVRLTVKELIERYPRVDWRDTFQRIYSPIVKIRDDDLVAVTSPEIVDQAIDLVLKTSQRVLANFAIFQTMSRVATTNQEILDKYLSYMQVVRGKTEKRSPRWIGCVDIVKSEMPLSVIGIYAKKYFKPEIKEKVEDIIREIRGQFYANIDKVRFLDNVTEVITRKKEKAIKSVIGYPDGLLDNDNLDNYYKDLNLFENNYFLNQLNLMRFENKNKARDFRKPVNKTNSARIIRLLVGLNANAEVDLNSILLTTGILQGAVFHPERPRYINFATIGLVIGHEVTHFFDTEGSSYDENGNKKDWWTPATKKAFEELAKCFVEQYGNYTEDTLQLKVDGESTLDENIADNGGAKLAYYAYVNSMRGKTPEKRLHGLDYSPRQMFWIAFGNLWCKKYKPEYLKYEWTWSSHTYARFRVIGTVSNSEEFAKDFECPPNSKMNPAKKCFAW